MSQRVFRTSLAALTILALLASNARAEKKPVPPVKEFTGSVDDETLLKDAPALVTNAQAMEKLWKDWKIAGKAPDVDFSKQFVVITTTRGSRIKLSYTLDEKGDLQGLGLATSDLRPGFRYVLAILLREGVKTVNGKELPKQ